MVLGLLVVKVIVILVMFFVLICVVRLVYNVWKEEMLVLFVLWLFLRMVKVWVK